LVKALKTGLAAYAARTPIASRLAVLYTVPPGAGPKSDRWKNWVFSLSGQGYFQGEQSVSSNSWGLNMSANRITADIKLRLGLSADFRNDSFEYDSETISSTQESYSFSGLYVKGLGDHWSAGVSLDIESSSYSNTEFRIRPAPAVEYNVFPYSQSSRHQLRLLYRLGFQTVRYRAETIYFKTRETLLDQSLSATLDLKEKWGSISASLSGQNYFHDFSKYQIGLFGSLNLNLLKGLSAYAAGGGSIVHDQLSLVKGEASLEEVLLRRRQLESGYNYFIVFGVSYTFGSIFTNVINPRFGSSGGGGVSIIMN
jgi:hypothetical protein